MDSNRYHRSFIILKSNDEGYKLDAKKEPAGYVKLEIKKNQGRMGIYVQDLKPIESKKGIYDIVLISNDNDILPIKLTSIQVPDNGRGEYEVSFDPESVQDTGLPIDTFHAIVVVHRSLDGTTALRYPLVGYSDKRVQLNFDGSINRLLEKVYYNKSKEKPLIQWDDTIQKQNNSDNDNMTSQEEYQEEITEKSDEQLEERAEGQLDIPSMQGEAIDIIEDHKADSIQSSYDYQDNTSHIDNPYDERNIIDSTLDEIESFIDDDYEFNENLSDLGDNIVDSYDDGQLAEKVEKGYLDYESKEDTDIFSASVPEDDEISLDYEEDLMEDDIQLVGDNNMLSDSYDTQAKADTYWDKVKDYFTNLFNSYRKVAPFDDAFGEVDWIRVENRREHIYDPYYIANHDAANINNMAGNYVDHYLVGLVRDKGNVKYLVYGVPGVYSMIPPMSLHGFSKWLPVKNGYGRGYWLLYIDAKTGDTIYPY